MHGRRQQQRDDDGELIAKFDGRSVTYGFGDLGTALRGDDSQEPGTGIPSRCDP
jgi:hypothetical protein